MDSLKVEQQSPIKNVEFEETCFINKKAVRSSHIYWRAVKIGSGRQGGGVDDHLGQERV